MSQPLAPWRADTLADQPLITTTEVEGLVLVTVACESLRERQAGMLRDRMESLADEGKCRIAVCLAGVASVCAACLTDLVLIHQRCRARGGGVVVFGLKKPLRDMLASTGIFDSLPLADDLAEALRMFRAPAQRAGFMDRFRRTRAA